MIDHDDQRIKDLFTVNNVMSWAKSQLETACDMAESRDVTFLIKQVRVIVEKMKCVADLEKDREG